MKNKKAKEKFNLIYEFGILMQPLELLAKAKEPSSKDLQIAIAMVRAGNFAWQTKAKIFCKFAPDLMFETEFKNISIIPLKCWSSLETVASNQNDPVHVKSSVEKAVATAATSFWNHINLVPIEWEPVIFEANTPFTSYLRIKESIISVQQQLHYFDRYLTPDFFHLFLDTVDKNISIRLVTTKYGVKNVAAVSALAQKQFVNYKLIQVSKNDLHDRNLRVDNLIFTLGPGTKAAGIALTNFGPTDHSAKAHAEFDKIIAKGTLVE